MSNPHDSNAATGSEGISPARFAKIREIFEAALVKPAAERSGYLEGVCAGDRELLREVQAMLRAEDKADAFIDRPRTPPPSSSPEEGRFPAGTILAGRYRILGLVGAGGMGEVYRAYDQILNQTVALKFLAPAHINEAALVRFRNEVRIARQVSHPNVCRVYDLGMVEGLHFLSMEYIDGEDLASLLRRIGRLPQDKAIEFTRKICAGLGAAHERGVPHRDLKPSNIMIDGRGHVRITDFGLAGLAAEIPLSDLRSGTPAYMSPEQKAGREVTVKSDIYSLGLVLHEMFTGKQRSATQSNPTDLVKDLDPAIERLILRCLEEEPRRRPNSAFSVAMSLPGADPVAAALAAGETPSPEMVAASQEKEGLSARTAALCFAAVVLCFAFGLWASERIGFLAHMPTPQPPEVLEYQAEQFIRAIGYTEEPVDRAHGFDCCDPQVMERVRSNAQNPEVWSNLRPPVMRFWSRQHRKAFVSDSPIGVVSTYSPPHLEEGMIRVDMDPTGRLERLDVRPWRADVAAEPINWDFLFDKAGLDQSSLTPADASKITPSMTNDKVLAWTGETKKKDAIRVEAASWRGRPVYFAVLPQNAAQAESPQNTNYPYIPPILIAAWLAWNNRRLGRGDRRGALVLSMATLAATALGQILLPSNDGAPFSLALVIWIYYMAVEPYVRRNWPDSLISWARLTSAKIRDPLVASHVLLGIVSAEAFVQVALPFLESATPHLDTWPFNAAALGSISAQLGVAFFGIWTGIILGLLLLVVAVVLRFVVRNLLLADALAGFLVNVMNLLANYEQWADHGWQQATGFAFLTLTSMIWLWLLRRFGFLTMLTLWVVAVPIMYLPLRATGWIAGRTIPFQLIPIALAAWALWVILSSERQRSIGLAGLENS